MNNDPEMLMAKPELTVEPEKRTIVSAVLLSSDNCILLGKKATGGVYSDCWHIPGGGVDGVETNQQALVREIQEEVGLDISEHPAELLSDSDSDSALKTDRKTGQQRLVHMTFFVYLVRIPKLASEIDIQLHDDLVEYQWVDKNKLSEFQLTPPSMKLFTKLGWL